MSKGKKKKKSSGGIGLILVVSLVAFAAVAGIFGFRLMKNRTPQVTLKGDEKMLVYLGEGFDDPGAKGRLVSETVPFLGTKAEVKVSGTVNSAEEGEYTLTYTVTSGDQKDEKKRIVTVVERDETPPEISLAGGEDITVYKDSKWKDSFTAKDNKDGDITDKVEVTGKADTKKEGSYTIEYAVEDRQGNRATAMRTVTVEVNPEADPDKKIIYLTFDDGPGPYTDRLLDILESHDVKVTFFVTGIDKDYRDEIKREAEDGHTVAIHTYTHEYSQIYSSTEAYWDDFNKMQDLIREETGSETNLFRFPGGSSNTVSRHYCDGIMTELTAQAKEKGYHYFDWNISSGDAGETTSSDVVFNNLSSGVGYQRVSVILCHDIKDFTVNAMDRFISWAKDNGYTFLPLSEGSFEAHHDVNN